MVIISIQGRHYLNDLGGRKKSCGNRKMGESFMNQWCRLTHQHLETRTGWCKHLISLIFTVQRKITLHLQQKFSSSSFKVQCWEKWRRKREVENELSMSVELTHSKSWMRSSVWAWWLHFWQHCYEEITTTHRRAVHCSNN